MFYDLKLEHWENIKYARVFQDYLVKLVYKQLTDEKSHYLQSTYAIFIKECIDPRTISKLKDTKDEVYIENYNALLGGTIDNLYNICKYIINLDISESKKYQWLAFYLESLCKILEWFFVDEYALETSQYKMIQKQNEYLATKELNLIFTIIFLIDNKRLDRHFFELVISLYKIKDNKSEFYRRETMDIELMELLRNNLAPGGSFIPNFEYNKYRLVLLFYEFINNSNLKIVDFLNYFEKESFLESSSQRLSNIVPKLTINLCSKFFEFEEERLNTFRSALTTAITEKENKVKEDKAKKITELKLIDEYVQKFIADCRTKWLEGNNRLKEFLIYESVEDITQNDNYFGQNFIMEKMWFIEPYENNVCYDRNSGKGHGEAQSQSKYKHILETIYNDIKEEPLIIKDIFADLSELLETNKEYFFFYNDCQLIYNLPNLQWINTGHVRAKITIKESVINLCFADLPFMMLIEKNSYILKQSKLKKDNTVQSLIVKVEAITEDNIKNYVKVNKSSDELKQMVNIVIKEQFEIIRNPKLNNPLLVKLKL